MPAGKGGHSKRWRSLLKLLLELRASSNSFEFFRVAELALLAGAEAGHTIEDASSGFADVGASLGLYGHSLLLCFY